MDGQGAPMLQVPCTSWGLMNCAEKIRSALTIVAVWLISLLSILLLDAATSNARLCVWVLIGASISTTEEVKLVYIFVFAFRFFSGRGTCPWEFVLCQPCFYSITIITKGHTTCCTWFYTRKMSTVGGPTFCTHLKSTNWAAAADQWPILDFNTVWMSTGHK